LYTWRQVYIIPVIKLKLGGKNNQNSQELFST